MFGLNAGTLEQKGQLLEAFLEQWGAKQGSGCHVATSPRRDVPTSPRRDVPTSRRWVNNAEVNNQKRRDIPTSRRLNVATLQRRDVPTSRRLNVATLQRRDVNTGSALHHLKHEWFGI